METVHDRVGKIAHILNKYDQFFYRGDDGHQRSIVLRLLEAQEQNEVELCKQSLVDTFQHIVDKLEKI